MRKTGKILSLLLVISLSAAVISCGGSNTPETTTDIPTEVITTEGLPEFISRGYVELGGDITYDIIRSESDKDEAKSLVGPFRTKINAVIAKPVGIATDFVSRDTVSVVNTKPEILVGDTNRVESAAVKNGLEKNGYAMDIVNGKIVIVGENPRALSAALNRFLNEVVFDPGHLSDGKITVRKSDCFRDVFVDSVRIGDLIGKEYTIKLKFVMACPQGDVYRVAQGAASDGRYVYFLMRESADGDGIIVKYELSTRKRIAESKPFHVFHGNDMTYDTAHNQLVVVHGSSEGKILTLVDADTLEVAVQSKSIPNGAGALTYNPDLNIFAGSQGGKSLYLLNGDYTLKKTLTRKDNNGYVAQGMGSDDKYIYFPMSKQNGLTDNVLETYTWEGKYVGAVHIPTGMEAETCFFVEDTLYISFYSGGAQLYAVNYTLK